MNTKDTRCFVRCYEEQSINKAAKQWFITPQGLSKVIQNPEDEFHTKLFERTSRGIRPSESGDYFYRHYRELLNKLEEIIANGKADIVYMARALLADPFIPRKVTENKDEEIVKCLRCFTCMAERAATATRRCTVNPLKCGHCK